MATQDIVIRVVYESDLKQGIQEVEALGKAAKKDIDVFKSLSKEVGTGLNTSLKDAGASARQMADSVTKAGKSGSEFKTLKQQIKEARNEAQLLAAEFGDTSTQAVNAQKKIANLTDELGDFNSRVQALNPEAKFKAFGQVAQGAVGGLQGLTGALQIFGSENEEVNKIVQKFQGFINLTQGIESIAGLSDTFKSLKVVLGLTTVSQEALAAATVAEGVAAEGAAVANKAFAASLSATGIGAIVVGIGLLIGAWIAYTNSQDEATAAAERFKKSQKVFQEQLAKEIEKNKTREFEIFDNQIRLLEIAEASEKDILKVKREKLLFEIRYNEALIKNQKTGKEIREELILQNRALNFALIENNAELAKSPKKVKETAEEVQKLTAKTIETTYLTPQQKKQLETLELVLSNNKQKIGELAAEAAKLPEALEGRKAETSIQQNVASFIAGEDAKIEAQKETTAIILQGASDTASALNELSQIEANNRIALLDTQLNAGLISEQEYAKKVGQIKRKQAEADKKTALFNAAIGIAGAIINALNFKPANAVPAAVAFASVLGAVQLATIAARPIPAFNKGTLSVPGVYQGKDSVLANLTPGEAVIPQPMKNAYLPTLQAMFNGTVNPSELNAMVTERRTGRSRAASDNSDLIRAIKAKSSTSIRNAEELARLIGKEISNSYNPRYN
jgi:hypothetical protein